MKNNSFTFIYPKLSESIINGIVIVVLIYMSGQVIKEQIHVFVHQVIMVHDVNIKINELVLQFNFEHYQILIKHYLQLLFHLLMIVINELFIHLNKSHYLSVRDCQNKYRFLFTYSTRPKDPTKTYSIHIDFYEKE